MSGPTLGLGITASGVEQMRALAQATEQFDKALASLESRGVGGGTQQLSGLAALQSEVQKIRTGLGEATAGLRTDLADLKATMERAFAGTGKAISDGSTKAAAEIKKSAEKVANSQAEAAAKQEQSSSALIFRTQRSLAKFMAAQAEAAAGEGSSIDKRTASLMVGSAKIVEAQQAVAETAEASNNALIFRTQRSLAKFMAAQAEAAAGEGSSIDKRTAALMVGSAKITAAQAAAAESEEAATTAMILRANKGVARLLAAREEEAAQVTLSAQKLEAAYAVMTPRQQLNRQISARSQLDQGVGTADVMAAFGNTATSAAASKNLSALEAELNKLPRSAHGAGIEINSVGDALGLLSKNSRTAREGMSLIDEALQNRFKNMAGTFVALLNAMGFGTSIFSATSVAVLGVAAAIGLFATAVYKGSTELTNFNKQAIMTGGAIGLSSSGFTQMRDALAGIAGTKGKAAEALETIAASGLHAGDNTKMIAEAAIMVQKAVGTPLADTVKQFQELEHAPLQAVSKLNEHLNFLTASVYNQIDALVKQGKTQEAADLAQKTLADSLKERSERIIEGQGYLERAWHATGLAARWAWDQMLGLGREKSPEEQLKAAADNLAAVKAKVAQDKQFGAVNPLLGGPKSTLPGYVDPAVAEAQKTYDDLVAHTQADKARVEADKQRAAQEKGREDFNALRDKNRNKTPEQKLKEELDRIRTTGKIAGASQKEIDDAIAEATAARNRNKGKGSAAGLASSIEGQGNAAAGQAQLYRELMDRNDTTPIDKLTAAEKELYTIEAKLRANRDEDGKVVDARADKNLKAAEATAKIAVAKEKDEQLSKVQHDAWIKDLDAVDKLTKANDRSTDSIEQKTAQVAEENKHWGKNKTAIEQANLAELQNQLRMYDSSADNDDYVKSLERKTNAQAEYVKQLQLAEVHAEKKKLNEAGLKINEDTTTLEMELSLVGKTAVERDRIMASRKAEIDLAKELHRIDNLNADQITASGFSKSDLEQQARDNAAKEAQNLARKQTLTEWQKLSDQIETTLTDAILNAVHNGGNAFKSLRDTLKQMFDTLVLRPIIQAVMAPVSSQLGAFGTLLSGGSTAAAGGMTNTLLNNSGLLGSAVRGSGLVGGTGPLSGVGSTLGLNGTYGMGAGAATGADLSVAYDMGSAAGIGAGGAALGSTATTFGVVDGVAATTSLAGGAVATGAAGTSIGAAAAGVMAAIPVAGWIALAAVALYSIFSKKGGAPKLEGTYNPYNTDQYYTSNNADAASAAHKAVTPIQAQYDALAKQFGVIGDSGIKFGLGYSTDPKGTAPSQVQIGVGKGSTTLANLSNTNVGRDDQSLQAAIADLGSRAILTGLQNSNLGGKFGTWINSLNIPGMASDVLGDTMTRLNKIASERSSLQQRLDASTGTALEKLNKQRTIERANIDDVNKLMLEQVYAQEDLVSAGQKLLTAYNTQQQTITSLQTYATALRDWVTQALTGTASPLSAMEQLTQAAQQFDDTLAKAHGGDATAQGALTGTASTYLTALQNTAASRVDYAMGFAKVTSALTVEAASADSQATVMQQQLDTAKGQLAALGLIDASIETFQQAWADFNNAQAAVDAAKAASSAADNAAATPVAAPAQAAVLDSVAAAWASAYGGSKDGAPAVQGFASGGYHRGGLRVVGEHGPELEVTGPSYIHDAAATRQMLRGQSSNDDGTVAGELRELRREMQAQVGLQNQLTRDFRELKNRGFPVTNTGDAVALNTHAV